MGHIKNQILKNKFNLNCILLIKKYEKEKEKKPVSDCVGILNE